MLPPLDAARCSGALFIILSFGKFQGPLTHEKEEQIMRKKNTVLFSFTDLSLMPFLRSFSHSHWLKTWVELAQEQWKVIKSFKNSIKNSVQFYMNKKYLNLFSNL